MKRPIPLLFLLLVGCVTTQSLPVEDRSRTYDLDYDFVFDATVQMLAERGFAIIDAEKDEGIINTDYRAQDAFLSSLLGSARLKVSALVSDAPDGTRVLLNFDLQDVDQSVESGGAYNSRSITPRAARRYYREFFDSLEDYLAQYDSYGQIQKDDLQLSHRISEITDENIFKTEGYYNWGASIYHDAQGVYHMFYSRWNDASNFTGWLTNSEIARATSKNPSGPWTYQETVLTGRGEGHWDAITAHNPKIKYFEDKFYLYYISTNSGNRKIPEAELVETAQTGYDHPNWKMLRTNQRTGVAVSNSIRGPWERLDNPLIEPSGPITTLTVNPAIDRGSDGNYYLIVKGDKPNETDFVRNQAIAISDSPTGPFIMQEKPVIDYMDTEDMSLWFDATRERFYGVFHAHTYIGLITSKDGINWKKAKHHVLMEKKIRLQNGTTIEPDRMERPYIFTENGKPITLILGVKKGGSSYNVHIPFRYLEDDTSSKS